MNRAISYSLFGYNRKTPDNCFEFATYMRGLHIAIRFNRILYPGWITVVNVDHSTYNSEYKEIFDWHVHTGHLRVNLCPDNEPLCLAMLWRMKTVFDYAHPQWTWSHVIMRDLDSIATFREVQMVQEWVNEDKTIHCITDSVSHNIPMMGGMIGIRPAHFASKTGIHSWDQLIAFDKSIDFSVKGSDQTFMNRAIYPKCADSSTEHFIKGMVHNLPEGNGRHYRVNEDLPIGVDERFKETNLLCGHVGAAGYYEAPTMKFLHYSDPYRDEYVDLERRKQFQRLFYWAHG